MTVVQESDYFYVRRFRTLQSIRCSHIWQWCNAFPAVLDLPYCQSFARFFCSMVWNPCKPAVFLPYCQSFGRFFCNVVNIHRHRPTARFICNDGCFCAIWPYFDYRYRRNVEFLCNDRSVEELPAHLGAPAHLWWYISLKSSELIFRAAAGQQSGARTAFRSSRPQRLICSRRRMYITSAVHVHRCRFGFPRT